MSKYQGHTSKAAWNVSLWISNDEGLYTLAKECIATTKTLDEAANRLYDFLEGQKTPDGFSYNRTNIRRALSKDM